MPTDQKKLPTEIPLEEQVSRGKLIEERKKLDRERKSPISRTVFKLPENRDEFLRHLGSLHGMSIRGVIDLLVALAEQAYKEGRCAQYIETGQYERVRRSYALSKSSLKIINSIHKKMGIPREHVLFAGMDSFLALFRRDRIITTEMKKDAAEILSNAAERMLEIYYSEKVSHAREILINSEDPVFEPIDELLGYIEQLNELPSLLDEFQRRVKDEKS